MSRETTLSRYPGALRVHRWLLRTMPGVYATADLMQQIARAEIVARRSPWRSQPRSLPPVFTKTSDTLFVLGSGLTVNELTDTAWDEVAGADSLGLNFWLLHRFVPTAYVQEWISVDDDDSVDARRFATRLELLARREDVHRAAFYFRVIATRRRRGRLITPDDAMRQLPVANSARITSDLNLLPLDVDGFRRTIRLVRRLGLLRQRRDWRYLVTARGTVLWAVMFAARLGYRRVVLIGVDLNGAEYFYDQAHAPGVVPGLPAPPTTQSGTTHRTNDPSEPGPTMEEILVALRSELLDDIGLEVLVGHPASALAAHFAVHDWRADDALLRGQERPDDGADSHP